MLSLVHPDILPPSDPCKGLNPSALQPLLSWFQQSFQQLPPALPHTTNEGDELVGEANGVDSVIDQLQAAAACRQGTAEQLQSLFVALCRAQGLLVRSVRYGLSQQEILFKPVLVAPSVNYLLP